MKPRRKLRQIAAVAALVPCLLAGSAQAVPGGEIHTLAVGHWICEQPGDATTRPVRLEADDFWVVQDSSYRVRDGRRGTYALLGDRLTMTTGPFEARAYALDSAAMLRPLNADGAAGAERCVKSGTPSAYVGPAPAKPASPPAGN